MVGLSRSSNSSRSSRRRLAQGAKGNDSSCCRPRSRHNLFLQTRPSLSATACSWFMMRCAPAPSGDGATVVVVDPDFPSSGPKSVENDLPSASAAAAGHPPDPSSACVPAWFQSPPRRRSTTQSSAPPAIVQTSVHAHWLPSPLAPSFLAPPGLGKTFPLPRGAATAVLHTLRSRYPQTQFAESPGDNRIL